MGGEILVNQDLLASRGWNMGGVIFRLLKYLLRFDYATGRVSLARDIPFKNGASLLGRQL